MLKSEINTPEMEREILNTISIDGHFLTAVFEHGHWWVQCACGAQWSVVDTSEGFDTEQVSQGDEDFHVLDDYANPREGDYLDGDDDVH